MREVLVIAAALSIQDPRERPPSTARRPTSCTAASTSPGCDLLSIVAPVGPPARAAAPAVGEPVPQAVPGRVPQLPARAGVAGPVQPAAPGRRRGSACGAAPTTRHARPRPPSRARRAAVAPRRCATADGRAVPRRARRVVRHRPRARCWPGSPPRWVMAAELVETNRLWARRVAAISPSGSSAPAPTSSSARTASRAGTPAAARR